MAENWTVSDVLTFLDVAANVGDVLNRAPLSTIKEAYTKFNAGEQSLRRRMVVGAVIGVIVNPAQTRENGYVLPQAD